MSVIKVFISYAHESDKFRRDVKTLVKWLKTEGISSLAVASDFDHPYKAPSNSWPVWMEDKIEEADIVLIICTPKYLERFRRKEIGTGKGVSWEGAIITQDLYNQNAHNGKFVPIIPDGGSETDVPKVLQGFFNYLSFPSKNRHILKCILDDPSDIEHTIETTVTVTTLHKPDVDIQKIEVEIIEQYKHSHKNGEVKHMSHIEILVRAYLQLNDVQKISIARSLGVYEKGFEMLPLNERFKTIFQKIQNKGIISDLWDKVNELHPFENKANPFKS